MSNPTKTAPANRPATPFDILLPYQRRIFDSPSDKIICCCSRQIGKSFLAAAKCVREAILNPGSLTACISTGERAAKEFLLKVQQWAEACMVFADPDTIQLFQYQATATEVKFGNGSRIIVLPSGNPRSLRGYTGSIVIDEMALLENDTEVWAAIAPLLTNRLAHKNKWIMVLSTPTGLNTEFAKIWQSDRSLGWEKHRLTIYDAVKEGLEADPVELQKLINDPAIWETEYECKFASTADTAFPMEWLSDLGQTWPYNPALPAYIGVDVARTSDFTVFAVIQADLAGCYHLVDLITLQGVPFNEQLSRLKEVCKKYRIAGGFIDSTGIGAMFAEEACRTISARLRPFVFSAARKTEILERLRKTVSQNSLKVRPEDVEVVSNDLGQMRRLVDASIHYTAPHTKSGHADIATAIALSLQASHDVSYTNALPISSNIESRMSYFDGFGFGCRLQ